jgi:hypothetical protein
MHTLCTIRYHTNKVTLYRGTGTISAVFFGAGSVPVCVRIRLRYNVIAFPVYFTCHLSVLMIGINDQSLKPIWLVLCSVRYLLNTISSAAPLRFHFGMQNSNRRSEPSTPAGLYLSHPHLAFFPLKNNFHKKTVNSRHVARVSMIHAF